MWELLHALYILFKIIHNYAYTTTFLLLISLPFSPGSLPGLKQRVLGTGLQQGLAERLELGLHLVVEVLVGPIVGLHQVVDVAVESVEHVDDLRLNLVRVNLGPVDKKI